MDYAQWLTLHLALAIGFLVLHLPTMAAMFWIPYAQDAVRLNLALRFSFIANVLSQLVLLGVIGTGVQLARLGGWWSDAWPWASLVVLVAVWTFMFFRGTKAYEQLRKVLKADPDAPPELWRPHLNDVKPGLAAIVGTTGLFTILWLMFRKPF